MVIEIKNYQSKNILIKLKHIQKILQSIFKNLTHGKFNEKRTLRSETIFGN